eukprot:gb/GECG01010046.1/.p1 GENE.gb/GECG01010046.1/~~gb/GECG01010046.1/.p1  ORF type:complete len:510 (+),score=68.20 gb/GECG01010046.1/:1-1530(+)
MARRLQEKGTKMSTFPSVQEVLEQGRRIEWSRFTKAGTKSGDVFLSNEDRKRLEGLVESYGDSDQSSQGGESTNNINLFTEFLAYADKDSLKSAKSLVKALKHIRDSTVVRYLLTVLETVLDDCPSEATIAQDSRMSNPALAFVDEQGHFPLKTIISLIKNSEDAYIIRKGSRVAALLLVNDDSYESETHALLNWIVGNIKEHGKASSFGPYREAESAVSSLSVLVKNATARSLLINSNVIQVLPPLLQNKNMQFVYEVAFCLWVLSFERKARYVMYRHDTVYDLCLVCKVTGVPMKILRMAIGTVTNLIHSFSRDRYEANSTEFVEPLPRVWDTQLPKVVEHIHASEKFDDEELNRDAEWLRETLQANKEKLASIDKYKAELYKGSFSWGILHRPEFWRENYIYFEYDDFDLVRRLHELLRSPSADKDTVIIACHDIGQFAVFHPQGKTVLSGLGVKDTIMGLLNKDDPELRQQALLTLSKLMVQKWQFVGPEEGGSASRRRVSGSAL